MMNQIKTFILLLALLLPVSALAYDFEVDGIYYYIESSSSSGGTVTVTYIYQNLNNGTYVSDYSGDVIIPSTVTYGGTTYTVTSIGRFAFSDCRGLTSVTIPNSVTSIGYSAFINCRKLKTVALPYTVEKIPTSAFYYCEELTDVTCLAITPPEMGDYHSFYPSYYMATLHVPAKSVEAYKATDWWNCFMSIVGDASEDNINPNAATDKCDTNDDGEVNIADVNTIINAILSR